MNEKKISWQTKQFDPQETFFRLIEPEDYPQHGIDPQDVPMGTFAAEDHPGFLPSRFGGNAYGLGLIEQAVLSRADTDFLESLNFQDIREVGANARKLNVIHQKLGLLIRYGSTGKRYFLIPINLVAHSLQEIKSKADEIEELIIQHIFDTRIERLDIGLLTSSHDLIVHELTARLSSHRIYLFDSIEKLRSWRTPLDVIILAKDPFEYLLEQQIPKATKKRSMSRRTLINYAVYLAGKIHRLLEPTGKIHVLAHAPGPQEDETCRVHFKSPEDLKFFLLFTHTFKTSGRYEAPSPEEGLHVHISDLHYYLNRFAFFEPHLKRLLNDCKPEDLSLAEIDRLPYLNLRLPRSYIRNPEKQWQPVFEPYFAIDTLKRKSPRQHNQYWQERLEVDRELPESLFVLIGRPRQATVDLASLEEEVKASGMQGCSLGLVAEYRNTFRFVLDVLKILIELRDGRFQKLAELKQTRLTNPFRSPYKDFKPVIQLLEQIPRLEKVREVLNPDDIEGQTTPILENIQNLSLHGFTREQLREILLILVGHSTMSRVVFGKLPAKTLKPITDQARSDNGQQVQDLLRACRLMSMAELIAASDDSFTEEQAEELFRLYDSAVHVAMDRNMDWDRLHDLRISALGGVQNKAIREMMKFFNLFDFLDDWQECIHKGSAQKEVYCDYEPEQLQHLEDALELARIAEQFKHQFMGDYVFGQSYFFRQFLDIEFHGTGHLFPKLGTRAGFIMIWIAVNSSDRQIINFNPMLSGAGHDRHGMRINKIKESLLRIPIERLQPRFFEEIRKTLRDARPAFIFDSGIRITANPEARVVNVAFVDIEEDLQQIEMLLTHFESQKLRGISLKRLRELERRFSELQSFHEYLHQEGCYLLCGIFNQTGGLGARDREIGSIEKRLKSILLGQIFIPEDIYDSLSALARHCPEILRFILPEFHALGSFVENWPTIQRQSLGNYSMRCIEKFQALVIRDRDMFQDRNVYYQLAKQEFGPLAEEGIGASHSQMEVLEYLVERIQQRPVLYQALTLALIFQEIGKIERYSEALLEAGPHWTHAAQGANILEKSDLLDKYDLDSQVQQLVVSLVRYHGLIGHVIVGEEPATELANITSKSENRLLDVYVLHSILAAAALREGLMVSDLVDVFLSYRSVALQIIKSKSNWESWLRESLREKGSAVLADFRLTSTQARVLPSEIGNFCGFVDADAEDEAMWQGRQSAALERLLKLMGAPWVDFQDLQMLLLNMPVSFIYHKKKLKSVGLATFEKQLRDAAKFLELVSSLKPEVRYYLLHCMDHLGGAMRVYDFTPLPKFLQPEECLKLLLISFLAFHHHFGTQTKGGLISFRQLSQNIERRHETLQNALKDLPFPERCFEGERSLFTPGHIKELRFHAGAEEPAIRPDYRDAIQFDRMVRPLMNVWEHAELAALYTTMVSELREKLPFDTKNFEEELHKAYEEQQKKINDHIITTYRERLGRLNTFAELHAIHNEMQEELSRVAFSEEQIFYLKEIFEFHRSQLRDFYLDSIYREINAHRTWESLWEYWGKLKYELLSHRSYVGKEYESIIARLIDQKMEEMSGRESRE
ncbi:MAG: hypothetical protein ABFD98_18635 [Syntrophobacteraceae bacterium]